MKMENSNAMAMFKNRISQWVKYSDYIILEQNGKKYISPAPGSRMSIYDPLADAEELVTDFLNWGRRFYGNEFDEPTDKIAMEIASKYGLAGWMVALPKDRKFSSYEETYLGASGKIFGKGNNMKTKEYIQCFTAHDPYEDDPKIAYIMHREDIYNIVFSSRYREPFLWSTIFAAILYAHFTSIMDNGDSRTPSSKRLSSEHMAIASNNSDLSLQMWSGDSPEMFWCFDSLKAAVETAYCAFLTANTHPLRVCKHCGKIYYHTHSRNEFCSPQCRNQWNVYRSRERTSIKRENSPE